MSAPITSAPADMSTLAGKLCECTGCGAIAEPTWRFDFFTMSPHEEGKPLLCESCLYLAVATTRNLDTGGAL